MSGGFALESVVGSFWFCSDDFQSIGNGSSGDAEPRDKPSSTDWRDHVIEIGNLLQEFQRDRPLSGDDMRMIVGRNHDGTGVLLDQLCRFHSRLLIWVTRDYFPAVLQNGFAFDPVRVARHDDIGGGLEELGGESERAGMISRAVRDHAACELPRFEMGQRVNRAAKLEGAGFLQVLAFEKQLVPRSFVERLASQNGRAMRVAGDVPRGSLDIGQLNSALRLGKLDDRRRFGGAGHAGKALSETDGRA